MSVLLNPYIHGEGDEHFANTVLLLSCDGASGSTTFTDQSAALNGTATRPGVANDADVDTSIKKFGTGSLACDGGRDFLNFADNTDWEFGSGDFTIECWAAIHTDNIELSNTLMCQWTSVAGERGWMLQYRGNLASNTLTLWTSTDGSASSALLNYVWTPTASQFYHIAVDRDSSDDWRLYVDGSMVNKVNDTSTIFAPPAPLRIGAQGTTGGDTNNWLKGWIDEPRITKGVARYASDGGFSVPTGPYPRF